MYYNIIRMKAVFRKLAQEQVKHIEEPALKCAERVHDEIVKIADRHLHEQRHSFLLFPEFRKAIKSVVHRMLNDNLEDVQNQIKDYIRVQASVVFSLDKRFLEKVGELRRELERNLHGDSELEDTDSGNGEQQTGGSLDWGDLLPSVPGDGITMKGNRKNSFDSNQIFSKLKNPSTTKLIKKMVNLYFYHIKLQTQDFIPKLVADRLITQFSSEDGNLGQELVCFFRNSIYVNYKSIHPLIEMWLTTKFISNHLCWNVVM